MHRPMYTASRGLSVHSKSPHLSGCVSTGNPLSFLSAPSSSMINDSTLLVHAALLSSSGAHRGLPGQSERSAAARNGNHGATLPSGTMGRREGQNVRTACVACNRITSTRLLSRE